ncbi:MAG: YwaF family protein [Acidimicrobiales bacterium]
MSAAYVSTLAITVVASVALCLGARRHPGAWVGIADRLLALILLAVSLEWVWTTGVSQGWSPADSLPLALCDVATLVAAAALWWRVPLLVELTWFWGLAGSLQSLITPDVQLGFPSATFIEYVVAHAGIVITALFLVVGQRIVPRVRAAPRVFVITLAYTAMVGLADALTGGDYMYLRSRPSSWTLLSVLGPWPWYILSAAGVALVLVTALDSPFWHRRRLTRSVRRSWPAW